MKFRTAYLGILGIVLITYGVILNMLGGMASFLHPGQYHSGALGTPMWCGLFFIIFGSVNLVKAVERTEEKSRHSLRLPIVLPITNLLSVFTSGLCIALTTWGMAANGVSLLTTNKVIELLVAVQTNSNVTSSSASTNSIQLSLVPLYSTVVVASSIILVLSLVGMCIDCVNVSYAGPRPGKREASPDLGPWGWEDREHHGQASRPYGDAVGEVTYGNTPALKALTYDKFYHNGGIEIKEEPAAHLNGGIPRAKNIHHHQDQVHRHLKRSDDRPKPYFYL